MKEQQIEKNYNDLNDIEKYIINEYHTWKKSDAPTAYKLEMLTYWRARAKAISINHLI